MVGDRWQEPNEGEQASGIERKNRASLSRCGRLCRVETSSGEHNLLQDHRFRPLGKARFSEAESRPYRHSRLDNFSDTGRQANVHSQPFGRG